MPDSDDKPQLSQSIEAVKLLADWAKWSITIETTAIIAISYVSAVHEPFAHGFVSILACAAVVCFGFSILLASLLLRSLPDLMQWIRPGRYIRDIDHEREPKCTTYTLASWMSVLFGAGVMLIVIVLVIAVGNR